MEGRVVSVLSIFEETRKRLLFAHSTGSCQLPVLGLMKRAKTCRAGGPEAHREPNPTDSNDAVPVPVVGNSVAPNRCWGSSA